MLKQNHDTGIKRPKRVSFVIEPYIWDAIIVLRDAGQLPEQISNHDMGNLLLRRALSSWLHDNEDPPSPWANIMKWLEAHPEAKEVSDRMFDAYSIEEKEALRDWGEEISVTDDDGRTIDFYTVTRVQAGNLAAREAEELAEIAKAHRMVASLPGMEAAQ
jgi:hypothetical protein